MLLNKAIADHIETFLRNTFQEFKTGDGLFQCTWFTNSAAVETASDHKVALCTSEHPSLPLGRRQEWGESGEEEGRVRDRQEIKAETRAWNSGETVKDRRWKIEPKVRKNATNAAMSMRLRRGPTKERESVFHRTLNPWMWTWHGITYNPFHTDLFSGIFKSSSSEY